MNRIIPRASLNRIRIRWVCDGGLSLEGTMVAKRTGLFENSDDLARCLRNKKKEVYRAFLDCTRAGRYIQNCTTENNSITTTGRKMKRFLKRNNYVLENGNHCLLTFLLSTSDEELKRIFGRRFLSSGYKRTPCGYNMFVKEHGFRGAGAAWQSLTEEEKAAYTALSATARPVVRTPTEKKANTWSLAIQEWNRRREDKTFAPIRKGSEAYRAIKAIQANIVV